MVEESKDDFEIDKILKDLSENSEEKPKFLDVSEKPTEKPEKPTEKSEKVQENSQKTQKVTFEEPIQDDDINYKLKSIQKELHRMKKEDENKNPKENSSSIFQKLQKFFSVFIVAFITNFSSDKILAENRSFAQNVLIKIFASSVMSIFVLFVFLK